jgi:hypothetical protein
MLARVSNGIKHWVLRILNVKTAHLFLIILIQIFKDEILGISPRGAPISRDEAFMLTSDECRY